MRILPTLLGSCLVLTATPAHAWNDRGHMAVAGVAWHYLSPQARQRASALLRLNPEYDRWTAGIAAADRDRVAFMRAATWPDLLRRMPGCARLGDPPPCIFDEGYTPDDAGSDLNIGYRDRRLRAYWHFMDLPYRPGGGEGPTPFRFNALTQIVSFNASLAEASLNPEARSYNLTWLLHMVGDVHQPLHATARFNGNFPGGDHGGNGVYVCIPAGIACGTRGSRSIKLHSYWDGSFGSESAPASVQEAVDDVVRDADLPSSALARAIAEADPEAEPRIWFEQSRENAIQYAYAGPVGARRGPYSLTVRYDRDARRVARERIAIAGRRLATLLNRTFG